MKHFKSVIAMLLVLVMVFSCVGTAFAADKTTIEEVAGTTKTSAQAEKTLGKGFESEAFALANTYKYADDEIVRAIVVLESAPEADVATRGSAAAAAYRTKLQSEQKAVRAAMKGIKFELQREFTAVLNGFSCDVAYGDLEAIAAIDGVEAVYIANHYAEPVLEKAEDTKMAVANEMTGNASLLNKYAIAGQGIVVAVLDTGLNTTHEAFQDSLGAAKEFGVLTEESVAEINTSVDGKYLNAKVPFAYDYADGDNDVTDHNGHGTHVSGTVGGYVAVESGDGIDVTFCGGAPAAQILSMKIFKDAGGGTSSDIYFAALDDAYILGADVVNMSIGAQNGFTYDSELETEVFGNIYKTLEDAGVIMSVAAGNEYSMAYYSSIGYIGPGYADYGTVASPSTYEGNVSVASVENIAYPSFAVQIGEKYYGFNDSSDADEDNWMLNFGGQTLDYVIVTDAEGNISFGAEADYANVDVTDKVAVVSRGEISFEEKVEFAANAGAKACIVVNNTSGSILMSIETFEIPAISMAQDALEALIAADPKQITVPTDMVYIENPNGTLMSDFSNWGTSPMLTLDPAITSVGGMVYSSVNTGDDAYEVYSGTSMATPNASASFANVLTAIYEINPEISKPEAAKLAKDLMASCGIILTDADDNEYSPRKQGAGLASSFYAVENYINSAYISDPLKELGDDPEKTGVYSFDVTVKNDSEHDCYYTDFDTVVLRDYIANINTEEKPIYGNTLVSDYADADVSYTIEGSKVTDFTVAAKSEVTITVTITLSEEEKTFLDTYFTNGTYIEGYVLFNEYYESEEGQQWYSDCHATFLAFYGDWAQGPAMEELTFMDLMEANYFCNTYDADGAGNTFADYGYNAYDILVNFMGDMYTDVTMGYAYSNSADKARTYLGANLLDLNTTEYKPEHISFSTEKSNGTYAYADSLYLIPSLLRNARHIVMTVTDTKTGEVYMVDETEYVPKGAYDEENSAWSNYSLFAWDGTDKEGNYVPSGTVVNVNFDVQLPWGEATDTWQEGVLNFDCTVDYTAPVLESVVYDAETETLTVTASDENYLAGIYLCDASYNILDKVTYSSDVKGESFTATFDVTGIDAAYVTALDYATNEIEEWTAFYATGEDATVTFVTPNGSKVIECKTGDALTIEAAEAPAANYKFMFWGPIEGTWSEETVWDVPQPWYFEGDTMEITEPGDHVFYAVYAEIETKPLEVANYYLDTPDDYTGLWSINGWDVGSDGYYVSGDPSALNCKGEAVKVSGFEDATIGDWYVEYFTNNTSIRFDIQPVGEGTYSIKSVETGKYLASDAEMNITFVDEVNDFATWEIFNAYAESGSNATFAYNMGVEDALLCYNDEAQVFEILDDSTPAYGSDGQYYASQWFNTFFYAYTEVEEIVLCYTTECTVNECYVKNFTDCDAEWYHEAIDFCVANGLMLGVAEDRFAPNATLNRAMVVTVLYRLAGSPEVEAPSTFTDVETGLWFSDAVAWAQANGIVNGVTEDNFAPFKAITREQIATILWRYAGSPEAEADMSVYVDADTISPWAVDAMNWAVSEKVICGVSETELKPLNNATRAQFACTIMRSLDGSYVCNE